MGVGYTICAMRDLGTRLATIFLDAGIPVVPLQASSCMRINRGRLQISGASIFEIILKNGGVPLIGGDVVFAEGKRSAIASADAIAVTLAKKHSGARLFFATDIDGVFKTFPPLAHEMPISTLDRKAAVALLGMRRIKQTSTDVTGAMAGKLRALLGLRKTMAMIFNGTKPQAFADVLSGKKRGTQVTL